jgi:hypothetical protein
MIGDVNLQIATEGDAGGLSSARQSLGEYSNKFSRHDFTLPQLFACLVVKQQLKLSYRGAEALLRDSESWLHDIGLRRAPDHNTLCRVAAFLLRKCNVDRLLDTVGQWAALGRILGLSTKPLALDSTSYESHHVSRHYERRCHETRRRMRAKEAEKQGKHRSRADTVRRRPKLAIAVTAYSHLILAAWTGTGMGGDQPHYEPLLRGVRRRVVHRRFKVAADAGYDAQEIHRLTRQEMGLVSLIPPNSGRPCQNGGPPGGRWRRHMKRLLGTKESRKRCGYSQRYQSETAHSMMKRNLGSALAGKTAWSRKRDMMLKVLTHNLMIL